jgi:hypothetical protein
MNKAAKKKVGRPTVKEKAESYSVTLKPTDKKRLVKKYSSLTKAIKTLL